MKIALIGGSGFIGTRLVKRLLASGHDVKIIDKNNSVFYPQLWLQADVRDISSIEKTCAGSDVIINLAAEHRDDVSPKSLYTEVNVDGARNVAAVAKKLGIRKIIFTSSVAVYGFAPLDTDETGIKNPFNEYGRTKMLAEDELRKWLGESAENSLSIIRPTVVFGERNRGNVYNLLKQMATGAFMMIGKGENVKSMAYVENVAGALEFCLRNGPGEHLFNYVDKPDFSTNELITHVNKLMGKKAKSGLHLPYWIGYLGGLAFDILAFVTRKKFPISRIRVKKFCTDSKFAASKIQAAGYKPIVSLADGIRNTVEFEFIHPKDASDTHTFISE